VRPRMPVAAECVGCRSELCRACERRGWNYIDLDGRHLGIGERVELSSESMFRTVAEAQEGTGDELARLFDAVDRRLSPR